MARTIITGATGLLGRSLHQALRESAPFILTPLGFSRGGDEIEKIDLNDAQAVDALFKRTAPDFVVHCAAERRPDVSDADPEAAKRLNVEATRALARQCRSSGAKLLYLSTDYVFDGQNPPYQTDSPANPLNFYGQTKLAGELAVQKELDDYLILRVPVLFGPVETLEESAITVIAKDLLGAEPKKVDDWAVRYPTSTEDIASVIRQMLEQLVAGNALKGVYHWSGDEAYTKYKIAQLVGVLWNVSSEHLQRNPEPPPGAPRPRNCQLDTSKLQLLGISSYTPFRESLAKAIEPFKP